MAPCCRVKKLLRWVLFTHRCLNKKIKCASRRKIHWIEILQLLQLVLLLLQHQDCFCWSVFYVLHGAHAEKLFAPAKHRGYPRLIQPATQAQTNKTTHKLSWICKKLIFEVTLIRHKGRWVHVSVNTQFMCLCVCVYVWVFVYGRWWTGLLGILQGGMQRKTAHPNY